MKIRKNLLSLAAITSLSILNANEPAKVADVTVVSAAGIEQNIADAAATISVITAEELQKKSYTDVTDALKNVPGVYINGGGSQQSIMIRGMATDYTLFLIDGKPMQGTGAFELNGNLAGAQMNFLPSIDSIERIEIIRGPASSLYGSDAMGGVINIITKRNMDKVSASISTEYVKADSSNKVNNDSLQTNVYINAPIVKDLLSVSLNGSFLNQDESNFQTTTAETASSDPEFKRKNIGTKFTLTPDDNNTITAGYTYTVQERAFNEGKSLEEGTEDTYYKSIKYNYSLTHEANYDKFLINSYINYDKAKNPSRTNSSTGNGIEFDTLTVNTQGTYFFDKNTTSVGLNYKDENLEDGATSSLNDSIVTMERYQWSLFAENEWSITDDLALTLSGRYDDNEDFGSNFSPKAYAVYHATDKLTVKGGVTSGYKAPSLRQAAPDFAGVSRGGVMIGNPDLTPEKSLNYEVGLAYNDYDLGLKGSIVAFHTDFEDKIQRTGRICDPDEACSYKGTVYEPHQYGYTAYENVDEAEIQGIELTTDYNITDKLLYRHSYTYTDSEQKSGSNEGKPLNNVSEHMFNAGLDWDATGKLNLWTQVNYRSKTAGSVSRSGELNRQPSYTFADVGLVYEIAKNISLKAGIYNLTNKEVTTEDGYDYILDGRRYSFAMNIKF
ncbi:TonB-dependent receptor [Halarcobacter mediterraneus]|uniref:TonB-dependent receptor n=2 Tax=Arcobacteraceae TaxID=2808963 RepID=A0A4Q1AZD5_9BACT|nr:TonB-dependent receptor [Halarcobacter mediterraneus]RXK13139.1 TonB-dependent receptor [Halarcobacter mediterraneus]